MEYKFSVFGTPVYWRSLPSGDVAIWHPYNPYVRSIIEPLCRGRGYWRSEHNNWIVFFRFRDEVLAEIAAAGDDHV
jgi:hypothetical protein